MIAKEKIIFMGTPEISSKYLKLLIKKKYNVAAVYSQPPRKKGRGMMLQVSPVEKLAKSEDLKILTPSDLNTDEVKKKLKNINPDLIIVMGYGLKLPNFFLNLPKFGCINIHVSLLPRWRGAAPIEHALMNGDIKTGITIFQINDEMDAGAIISNQSIFIDKDINKEDLTNKLNLMGVNLLDLTLPKIFNKNITYENQNLNNITFASKISTDMRRIDFNKDVEIIYNKIRAFSPNPAAWFLYNNERIKIIKSKFEKGKYKPSYILNHDFHIGCINGKICPEIIQREGKKPMSLNDFLRGFKYIIDTKLNA